MSVSFLLEVPDGNVLLVNSDKVFAVIKSLDRYQIISINTLKWLEKFDSLPWAFVFWRRNHKHVVSTFKTVHTGSALSKV